MTPSLPFHLMTVRVTPKSGKNLIEGWAFYQEEEVLKIRVTAPPEEGKTNEAVLHLLADTLGISKNRVTLLHGPASRRKVFKIEGWTAELQKKLPPNNLNQTLF